MNMKGGLRLLILTILNKSPNHGYQIRRMIEELSEGDLTFTEGTLYPTLKKMSEEGYIADTRHGATQRSGRNRRYYQITDKGRKHLQEQQEAWNRYFNAVNKIINIVNEDSASAPPR